MPACKTVPQERFGDSPAGITFQDQPAGTAIPIPEANALRPIDGSGEYQESNESRFVTWCFLCANQG